MRKRNHIIPLHLNKKELANLEAQVKLSGLAREEFLRSLIMGAQLQERTCTHPADLLHKVAGLCNCLLYTSHRCPLRPAQPGEAR